MTGKPIKARPIREVKRGVHSIYRVPMVGPITPRLQQPQPANAIGFHHLTTKEDVLNCIRTHHMKPKD